MERKSKQLKPSFFDNQIRSYNLYIMSKSINTPLRFYIKLTQIIGRTFTDLQELLKSELRYQEQQVNHRVPQITLNSNAVQAKNSQPASNNICVDNSKIKTISNHQQQTIQQRDRKQAHPQKEVQKNHVQKNTRATHKRVQLLKKKKIKIKKSKVQKFRLNEFSKIKKAKTKKQAMSEGKPYPPLNAFMLFLKENKYEIMRKRPQLSPSQVSIHASTIWNNYGEEEKQVYLKIYRKNHEAYLEQLKAFKLKKKNRRKSKQKNEQNSESKNMDEEKQKQKHDSQFEMSQAKSKQGFGIKLRQNLRSRKKKNPNEVICLQSSGEQQKESQENEQI